VHDTTQKRSNSYIQCTSLEEDCTMNTQYKPTAMLINENKMAGKKLNSTTAE
jgi:hypothetical protein